MPRPLADAAPARRRPDLLVIMADQLAPSALPFHGNPVTRTPAMSSLAESGVVFDAAYTASPLCAPARASLLTGRLPHGPGRQDALLRTRPDARVRGAAHHRRLSGRLRLDPGLGPPRRPAELVSRHVVGHRGGTMPALQPARLRRRGRVRRRAVAVRPCPLRRRAAVLLRGLVH